MTSMCSTVQSPRAANAFSSAWAARTCPAPDDADSRSTRGLELIRGALRGLPIAWKRLSASPSRRLAMAGGDFFQNAARHLLQVAEPRQVVLKFVVQQLGFVWAELCAQYHVAQFDRMRQQGVLLQFFESQARVVVIHGPSCEKTGRISGFVAVPTTMLLYSATPRRASAADRERIRRYT